MKLLLVEDEPKIAAFVSEGLRERGFSVTHADNGRDGHALGLQPGFAAIVLDLMLPGRDGLDVLADWRRSGVTTPVLLLTARNELGDRLQGLGLGADDYLAKPFFVEELAARLQALLRRVSGERQQRLQVGELVLDRIARTVQFREQMVELTSREFSLLEYLMRSPGQALTRAQILEHVWGYDFDPSTNVVDVCIKRIRARLSSAQADSGVPEAEQAQWIESVRGVGYRFRA
ncbi:response regulator transcription factor [Roseateles sp. BYS87W]|uniref:Response regulator transcription factor n=1 Tax=Pelomonas baiyunensis TaxID=3299026 RepID=A0ABW7H041_9BURK